MTDRDTQPASGLVSDDDETFASELRQLLPPLQPPPGFADRVLQAHALRVSSTPRRRWVPLLGAAAVGALAASLLWMTPRFVAAPHVTGMVTTTTAGREVAIDGALVTLGPQSALDLDDGVALRAGEAFFRVDHHDRDAPFTVNTPGGDVVVTGTCFTITIQDHTMLAQHHPRSLAVGAALGAALGVVVTVAVHEGAVTLRNDQGQVALHAGEHGTLTAASAPATATAASLQVAERRLATALSTVQATEAALAGDTRALVEENARLRAIVDKRDEELALLDVERTEREGEAIPFPKDLPARFTERELLSSLTTAMKEAGIKGDITAIDCAEFPCIVWGEAFIDTSTLTDQLAKSAAFGVYAGDGKHVHGWGSGESNSELFAITFSPKDPSRTEAQKAAFDRRLKARAQAGYEANKPASWNESEQ
jgi:hypothetical protein